MRDDDQSESEEFLEEELEEDEGEGEVSSLRRKIARLKEELADAQKERQEYLDGWQRARADAVNASREADARVAAARASGRDHLLIDLIPALDAFDMAMQSEGWKEVDETWRKGIEHIRAGILNVLEQNGVRTFGAEGEPYDPARHEVASEEKSDLPPHMILRVLRSGYASGERILRPAHVILSKES